MKMDTTSMEQTLKTLSEIVTTLSNMLSKAVEQRQSVFTLTFQESIKLDTNYLEDLKHLKTDISAMEDILTAGNGYTLQALLYSLTTNQNGKDSQKTDGTKSTSKEMEKDM